MPTASLYIDLLHCIFIQLCLVSLEARIYYAIHTYTFALCCIVMVVLLLLGLMVDEPAQFVNRKGRNNLVAKPHGIALEDSGRVLPC